MLSRIKSWFGLRQAAAAEAEALVWDRGARGVEMARTFSRDPSASEERRKHYRLVAQLADRRHRSLADLDTATRYEELARWQRRRSQTLG